MKKLLLFAGILIAANSFGQCLPNGGFESWNSLPYGSPASWYCSNPQSLIDLDSITCTQVTGFSGNAVHLHTIIQNGDTDFGFIINSPSDPKTGQGGVPYSQQSTGLTGYCKYHLQGNDTAGIMLLFKKNGAVFQQYLYKIRGATGQQLTWTTFNFTFTPALSQVPDSVIIAIVSSNVFSNVGMQNGSWLELDQLAFTGPNSPIPGGTFDTWNSQTLYTPVGWSISTGGIQGTSITRSATAYAGNYSISLVTQPSGGGPGVNNAMISNGFQSRYNGPMGGRPYTNMAMDSLKGYYMYSTPGNDSAVVNIQLSKNHSMVGGSYAELPKKATWTYFHIPFQAFSMPDTLLVSFSSGTWGPNSTVGSTLLLDNVSLFSQPLGLGNFNPYVSAGRTYPNPAKSVLNIEVSENSNAQVYIYDITGRVIMENEFVVNHNIIQLNVDGLNTGVYFYKVNTESGSFMNRFVKE